MKPDPILQTRIQTALLEDDRLSTQHLKVAVENGTVTLHGHVDNYRTKLAAQELAAGFGGVRGVLNRLEVRVPPPRSDEELAEDVRRALSRHPGVPKETILVSVREGAVTLSGEVSNVEDRLLAEDLALGVAGVKTVQNLVVVDWISKTGDQALAHIVLAQMRSRSGLRNQNIRVAITGNTARLSGTVRAPWQKLEAQKVVDRFRIPKVDNQILVLGAGG